MPSNTPLTDAINALTRYANETTGASDTTLSDAVGTLVAGYGGGGGGGLTHLATYTVNAERSIQIDIDPAWLSYDVLLIVPNITVSAADWIYLASDATSSSSYVANQSTSFNLSTVVWLNSKQKNGHLYAMQKYAQDSSNINAGAITGGVTNYLYYYTYSASKTMIGTMTVYGVSF